MNEIIKINNIKLLAKEYKGQRVVTFKDIDECHERPEGTARKRFSDNKKHFVEGVDYHVIDLTTSEKRTQFGAGKNAGKFMNVVTESGYMMLVKSFTDDLAWEVQRMLVNTYFKKENKSKSSKTKKERNLSSVNNAVKVMLQLLKDAGCNAQIQLLTAKTIYEQAGLEFPFLIKADDEYLECDKIADKLGVYSNSWNPHGKAIAAVVRKLDIGIDDYTETWESTSNWEGTVRKYNSKVYEMIKQWIIDNDCPSTISTVNSKGSAVNYKVVYRVQPNGVLTEQLQMKA